MTTTTAIPFTRFCLPMLGGCWLPPCEEEGDFAENYDTWVKGGLSGKSTRELSNMINNWSGCTEDLILMIMIAISKDMDAKIREKAEEVLQLRQANQGKKSADKNTEALDQAVQELQQMQKQRDQFFQMMQKILDGLTSSTDRLLQNWK